MNGEWDQAVRTRAGTVSTLIRAIVLNFADMREPTKKVSRLTSCGWVWKVGTFLTLALVGIGSSGGPSIDLMVCRVSILSLPLKFTLFLGDFGDLGESGGCRIWTGSAATSPMVATSDRWYTDGNALLALSVSGEVGVDTLGFLPS